MRPLTSECLHTYLHLGVGDGEQLPEDDTEAVHVASPVHSTRGQLLVCSIGRGADTDLAAMKVTVLRLWGVGGSEESGARIRSSLARPKSPNFSES